jgi:hypothetical protein
MSNDLGAVHWRFSGHVLSADGQSFYPPLRQFQGGTGSEAYWGQITIIPFKKPTNVVCPRISNLSDDVSYRYFPVVE